MIVCVVAVMAAVLAALGGDWAAFVGLCTAAVASFGAAGANAALAHATRPPPRHALPDDAATPAPLGTLAALLTEPGREWRGLPGYGSSYVWTSGDTTVTETDDGWRVTRHGPR